MLIYTRFAPFVWICARPIDAVVGQGGGCRT